MKNANIFLLDGSGSMISIKANVIKMYNAYLAEQKQVPDLPFTLIRFDSTSTDVVHLNVPVSDVPDMTPETFQGRHNTPLYDAMGVAITKAKDKYTKDDRVVFTVLTDGHENCSQEFTRETIAALVKEVSAWGWQFVFLGANFDAYDSGGAIGVSAGSTMSFDANDEFRSLRGSSIVGQSMRSYYSTGKGIQFSEQERAEVGDKFAPKAQAKSAPAPTKKASLIDDIDL